MTDTLILTSGTDELERELAELGAAHAELESLDDELVKRRERYAGYEAQAGGAPWSALVQALDVSRTLAHQRRTGIELRASLIAGELRRRGVEPF